MHPLANIKVTPGENRNLWDLCIPLTVVARIHIFKFLDIRLMEGRGSFISLLIIKLKYFVHDKSKYQADDLMNDAR